MDTNTRHTASYSVSPVDENAAAAIAAACNLNSLTARILVARGVDTPEAAQLFLTPDLTRDWHDPLLIPGMSQVADKVEEAIRAHKRILVFGDFDVDGITATTVSVRGLRALGADVVGLIPHRYEEGYALSQAAVRRGMEYRPDLIMTVDCGISCGEEVDWMLAQGIDVVVTDHHEPGEHVPQGIPVTDPKIDPDCPSADLAGVGVALKLLDVLGQRLGKPEVWRELTDFAALGTIADLMTLSSENRALVAHGLAHINNQPRVCIDALATICNTTPAEISSQRLSYTLIPRLNACGRMGDATCALELLLSDDAQEAAHLAGGLDAVNQQRREVEAQLTEQVQAQLDESFGDEEVIIAAGEGWHEGVKGIVASRIARSYQRPALIFTIEGDMARGSGRSYGNINLFELASSASDLFEKFGGHAAAIGITLPTAQLPVLQERLCKALRERGEELAPEKPSVDVEASLEECSVDAFQELDRLAPFGNTNPVPLLAAPRVFLSNCSTVGRGANHLRYNATDGISRVAGIWFNAPDIEDMVSCEAMCDIVFEPNVDEWQGRYTAKLMTRHIDVYAVDEGADLPENDPTEELLARAAEICDTGDYAGITQAESFNTKVVGVSFENRQDVLRDLEPGMELELVREPDNGFDENAIAVRLRDGGNQLGYLNRALAARLAPVMDAGEEYDAAITAITGGPAEGAAQDADLRVPGPLGVRDPGITDRNLGVNILVRKGSAVAAEPSPQEQKLALQAERSKWEQVAPQELDARLREALIGEHSLHNAQAQTLENLAAGRSTLTVMATGRGKSLIFHLHAARTALKEHKASVFVYPLRALVADQAFHLSQVYGKFGLTVRVLNGETENAEREEIYAGLAAGEIDVVLTTPEFMTIHAARFAETGRIGFVVVDEAHHVGQAKAGNRPAYIELKDALQQLGNPLVLAVTATCGDAQARVICDVLGIQDVVLDPTVRSNLHIDDKRDLRDRESYLASLVATGTKCVAYVNSREQSMQLTRMLRKRLPAFAPRIAFYNAGLPKSDRKRIEAAFREGELMAIVSTSAFGEGIDIPDVEHVILYHLPFNDIEFNQMSGRVGRDGRDACVHLLYGYGDARLNERILGSSAPTRDQMAALYRALNTKAKQASQQGEESFACTNADLAQAAKQIDRRCDIDESGVSCGISVFRELGFLETQGRSVARHISMAANPPKMNLTDSVRYREGLEEIDGFAEFKSWALSADSDALLARFNRPILPSNAQAFAAHVYGAGGED